MIVVNFVSAGDARCPPSDEHPIVYMACCLSRPATARPPGTRRGQGWEWSTRLAGRPRGRGNGLLAGVVNYITEPFYVHAVEVLLDYPIAFGAIGLAGLFQRRPVAGVVVGGAGRFVAHFLSGIVFFASYAPKGVSPAVYSAVYNGSYMLPEVIISSILTVLVLRAMERVQPVQPA